MNPVLTRIVAIDATILTPADEIDGGRLGDWHVKPGPDVRPLALVRPRTTDQVSAILAACNDTGTPVIPQGGLTGLVGGGTATPGALLLSLERMRAIEAIDTVAGTITVEAGVPLQRVQEAAEGAGMLFPLDIGARGSCQIGGNLATNAGGNRVLRYGMARALTLGLEVVLADGTILTSLNKMLKNNAAYDLKQLFIGSEGTLGVITRAVLRLFPQPKSVTVALCGFDRFDAVHAFLERARAALAGDLSAFEVMWPGFYGQAIEIGAHRPPIGMGHAAYVLVEMMGTDPDADHDRFQRFIEGAATGGEVADAVVAKSNAEVARLWAIRDMSGELTHRLAPIANFDVSIETGRIDAFLIEAQARCTARWPSARLTNFGHLADSNVHIFVGVDDRPFPADDIDDVIYGCVRDWGGSISAEHGIGLLKKPYLGWSRTPAEIATMRLLKRSLDPRGILNPGKVFDPA